MCEAGDEQAAPAPDDPRWLPIARATTVADALRAREEWTPDMPPVPFDEKRWWFRLRFEYAPSAGARQPALQFDGLATLARVWLNGSLLGESDNMFVAHSFDASAAVRDGTNELVIGFEPIGQRLAQRRPRPRWRVPMLQAQQLRWVRTTLLGRTPGWSPPAPPVGPWRAISLHASQAPRLRLHAALEGDEGVLRCEVIGAAGRAFRLRVEGHGVAASAVVDARDGASSAELRLAGVHRWWPHTHGEPALYDVVLAGEAGNELERRRVGFRTVQLRTDGGGFSVEVNGVPVFCRGACWMPLDAVSLRARPEDYASTLRQVRAAGMNMLRVAGTTVYEEDAFYDACDEAGVLVWHDFMFASMDYPAHDDAFVQEVAVEARQQLQRWAWRACIAVLCGNSEVEQQAAMWGAPRGQWHSALFDEVLPAICAQEAPGTPWWPSSAHGGALPFQADTGTTSYYGVGAYLRPPEDARRSGLRFATECLAFSNIPVEATLERMPGGASLRAHHPGWKARVPRDLGAGWDFEDVRDHYLRELTGLDPMRLRYADHARYLDLGRWVSGEVMAGAFAQWRRAGSGCRGALVLSLRDLWPGAGWGLLDDEGVPKPCWHQLARVLQPVTVLLTDEGGNGLFAHVVNDCAHQLEGTLRVRAWRRGVLVAEGEAAAVVPARGASAVPLMQLLEHFIDLSYAYRFGPAPCDVVAVDLAGAGGDRIAQALHFPLGFGEVLRDDPRISASLRASSASAAEVTLSAAGAALGVRVEAPGYVADRAWFHLPPGEEATVHLRAAEARRFHATVHALNMPDPVSVFPAADPQARR